MPLYDYKCKECKYVFETFQKITENPLEFCPKCSGPVRRLISPAGIIFKGSGFHVTDYGRKHVEPSKPSVKKEKTEKKTEKKKEATKGGTRE